MSKSKRCSGFFFVRDSTSANHHTQYLANPESRLNPRNSEAYFVIYYNYRWKQKLFSSDKSKVIKDFFFFLSTFVSIRLLEVD